MNSSSADLSKLLQIYKYFLWGCHVFIFALIIGKYPSCYANMNLESTNLDHSGHSFMKKKINSTNVLILNFIYSI